MIDLSNPSSAVVLFPLFTFLYYALFLHPKRPPGQYPPGPKPKPIIGNAMDIRLNGIPWLHYLEWSKRLRSDIVHMSVFNIHIVVLHKREDAVALLEKRSGIYSDRSTVPIMNLAGMDFSTGVIPYGNEWRRHRKFFQEAFRKDRIASYHHIITDKVHLFLGELLKNPSNFAECCKWVSASILFQVTFGYEVSLGNAHDRLIKAADYATETLAELIMPGGTMINIIPILGRIPPWFPGAYTQRLAASVKESVMKHKNILFEHAKNNMDTGKPNAYVMETLLRGSIERNEGIYNNKTLKDAMATTYFSGIDTVQNAILIFIFSMALHPESQRKAQIEIDRVIGTNRLPTYEDMDSLPYVEALYREIQRWRPVSPLGFPHTLTQDDVYKGFYIPKGTLVIPNIWAIGKEEATYQDPDRFMPERFFNVDGTLNDDTVSYSFGFGRRICAGRHIADSEVWLIVVCMLATFDIAKAKDDYGNEIDIDPNGFIDSLITRPLPFKCSILPRSRKAEKNICVAGRNVTSGTQVS